MADRDDRRLMGQELYPRSATPRWEMYHRWGEGWSHDHREFCGATLSTPGGLYQEPDALHEGYATAARGGSPDDYHWICAKCHGDPKGMFDWEVVR